MGEAVHTSPTIGSNVEEVIWRNIHFIMWDVGGQESLRASWSSYYTHTQFVILVIDSTDSERLNIIKHQLYSMLSHEVFFIAVGRLRGQIIQFVGNKSQVSVNGLFFFSNLNM